MIVLGTRAQGEARRRFLQLPSGFSYHKGEWLETNQDPLLSPTMFLIEQPADSVLPAHFHRENEFQVMVEGSGTIGRHQIGPIMVHYAGAFTGYGPIIAGVQGVKYFTIRSVFESGAMMVATDRDRMIRGPKRQVHADVYQPLGEAAMAGLDDVQSVELIAVTAEKLAARVWQLPPNGSVLSLDPQGSNGQFHMVLSGHLKQAGQVLRQWETVFVSADEPALLLEAGAGGAEVLMMQMPVKASEYRV